MKRLLSFLLAVCMTASFFLGAIPQVTLAAEVTGGSCGGVGIG